MSKSRPKLGRGLDALLGEEALANIASTDKRTQNMHQAKVATMPVQEITNSVVELPVADIHPGSWQPRRQFDEKTLHELTQSIRSQGVLQPILVCASDKGYAIIAGERRWRASQMAGMQHIPALIRSADGVDVNLLALIENIQREDLDVLEIAEAMEILHQRHMSHQSIASALGISRSAVTNTMRLLELPDRAKVMLRNGMIEMGHARAVLSVDAEKRLEAAATIAAKRMTVRQAEQYIKKLKNPSTTNAQSASSAHDPNLVSLLARCQDELATKVTIYQRSASKGELRIAYGSLDQLHDFIIKLAPNALQDES